MFRKVSAKELKYKEMENRFNDFFYEFEMYAQLLSDQKGNVENNTNKATSYRGYLIKLFVLVEEINEIMLIDPYSFLTYQFLNDMKTKKEFIHYNTKIAAKGFPSATIGCYLSFLINKKMEVESLIDSSIENESNSLINLDENDVFYYDESKNVEKPIVREEKVLYQTDLVFPRNLHAVKIAKENSNWQCEYNRGHKTFLDSKEKNFVEAHHLIPMATQELFNYTIDFSNNIICLCPNCHRKIHLARVDEKREMVYYFYNKRKSKYKNHGINISFEQLKKFYSL